MRLARRTFGDPRLAKVGCHDHRAIVGKGDAFGVLRYAETAHGEVSRLCSFQSGKSDRRQRGGRRQCAIAIRTRVRPPAQVVGHNVPTVAGKLARHRPRVGSDRIAPLENAGDAAVLGAIYAVEPDLVPEVRSDRDEVLGWMPFGVMGKLTAIDRLGHFGQVP